MRVIVRALEGRSEEYKTLCDVSVRTLREYQVLEFVHEGEVIELKGAVSDGSIKLSDYVVASVAVHTDVVFVYLHRKGLV